MADTIVQRSTVIAATPEAILPMLDDYRKWRDWSPWEDLDPDMQRSYTGPARGVGAGYGWSGNRKAGAGSMEVTAVTPESVEMALRFTKPFPAKNTICFSLRPNDAGTEVEWRLTSPKTLMMRIAGLFMNMDKTIGKDLERGLARLKALLERS